MSEVERQQSQVGDLGDMLASKALNSQGTSSCQRWPRNHTWTALAAALQPHSHNRSLCGNARPILLWPAQRQEIPYHGFISHSVNLGNGRFGFSPLARTPLEIWLTLCRCRTNLPTSISSCALCIKQVETLREFATERLKVTLYWYWNNKVPKVRR